MSLVFRRTAKQFSFAWHVCEGHAGQRTGERTRCAEKTPAAVFPGEATKVAVINVDTASKDVLLSGQEGICVQWR